MKVPASGSHWTRRWRKADSNPQSRSEKSGRSATRHMDSWSLGRRERYQRGTGSSNSSLSKGESCANLHAGGAGPDGGESNQFGNSDFDLECRGLAVSYARRLGDAVDPAALLFGRSEGEAELLLQSPREDAAHRTALPARGARHFIDRCPFRSPQAIPCGIDYFNQRVSPGASAHPRFFTDD
jgi:hypothetical protein